MNICLLNTAIKSVQMADATTMGVRREGQGGNLPSSLENQTIKFTI